jgi:alkylresorcinol/alkylpyrone synthase
MTHAIHPSAVDSPRLVAVATAVPPHIVRQKDARRFAETLFADTLRIDPRLLEVFENAEIEQRHVSAPLEWFGEPHTFAQRNALYVETAVHLGAAVTRRVLERAQLSPSDIDHVIFVSTTGISTPSMDALIANQVGFRPDFRRTPVWGLGCAGGAASLSHARDLALAHPDRRVLLIALELCTLTFLNGDLSKRNLVAASLFGDGAAALVVEGSRVARSAARHGRPLSLRASHSMLWKDTLDVMGWELDDNGLRVVFSRSIPSIVIEHVRPSLEGFLASQGLSLADVQHVIAHPGGVKVLRAYMEALQLDAARLVHARDVLRNFGNMSSPSCLFVLERFLEAGDIGEGDHGVVMALGPGFSAEYVLVRGEA